MHTNYKYKGLRQRLVKTLRKKGIRDEAVLRAISTVPRHLFMESAFEAKAYADNAQPIGHGQTISQPFTVAYQTELLNIKKRESVLEIGTGSGYQAAILAEMGARVFTLERHEPLYKQATALLKKLGYGNVRTYFRDGFKGLAELAPFDKILLTAGADEIPDALLAQLKIGGVMVIPLGAGDTKIMTRLTKTSEEEYTTETFGGFRFVPFVRGVEKER